MTSDAKIGLLLGLVFIFMIAFLINGLPSFRKGANNNDLTTNMVGLRNNPPGIGTREREVINRRESVEKQPSQVATPPASKPDVRFKTELPKSLSMVKETKKSVVIKPALPKICVVVEGDSLWQIAAEQLGDGSRYSEIARMNADILDDEDRLVIGMRLRMPAR